MKLDIHSWRGLSADERNRLLRRPATSTDDELQSQVADIIARVRSEGDLAINQLSNEFDGVAFACSRVGAAEMNNAEAQLSSVQLDAIQMAIGNVRTFHEAQKPGAISVETMPGVRCERVSQPIGAVGLYVPAGSAPLPSTAIMLCVPAAIAECPQRIVCTPPRRDGSADPAVLVVAQRCGADRVYKIGGAQAIAAMAYGTAEIPKADKIFGPGNAWVTAAKMQVASDPSGAAIDMPAGPSEVLVIADESARPAFIAADLLSQAEHGPDSQVILLSTCRSLAEKVVAEVSSQIPALTRSGIARQSMANGRVIVVDSVDVAIAISNQYAPEHLIIQTAAPRSALEKVRNAGSVFLGPWSPESAGDYCSGTNHVLPTYGYASSFSGLSVDQFMRNMTVQELTKDGLGAISATINALAQLEGLDGHANAVNIRFREAALES